MVILRDTASFTGRVPFPRGEGCVQLSIITRGEGDPTHEARNRSCHIPLGIRTRKCAEFFNRLRAVKVLSGQMLINK